MPRLIETLVAAFTDDPLYRWLYPDPTARADALWYTFAVHPSAQGLGLGAALLAPVLEGSDAAGIRVYLDSCNARNHSFFARLGFEAVVEAPVGVGGPTVHTMVRAAAARSVTATAHFRHESVWIEDPIGA